MSGLLQASLTIITDAETEDIVVTSLLLFIWCGDTSIFVYVQSFIHVFWEGAFFAKIGKETGHLGIKITGVNCKILEFCMILKKLQLGMGPVSGPCETRDKALMSLFQITVAWFSHSTTYNLVI